MSEPPRAFVDRVRKLLDKAEATDNIHEAEAFARKAAELVAQHRIDPDTLADTGRSAAELGIVEVNVGRGAYVRARLALLVAIADANDVRVVFRSEAEGTIAYCAGFRSDLGVVDLMYNSLHQQAAGKAAAIRRSTGAATQRYRRSFLFGFADRVGEILTGARRVIETGPSADADSSVAVSLRERAERVEEFVVESWGRVRSAGAPRAVTADGWRGGSTAADRADVGRPRVGGQRALHAREGRSEE